MGCFVLAEQPIFVFAVELFNFSLNKVQSTAFVIRIEIL